MSAAPNVWIVERVSRKGVVREVATYLNPAEAELDRFLRQRHNTKRGVTFRVDPACYLGPVTVEPAS